MIAWNEVLQYIHDLHINHRRTYSESNGFQVAIQDGIKTDAYLLVVLLFCCVQLLLNAYSKERLVNY